MGRLAGLAELPQVARRVAVEFDAPHRLRQGSGSAADFCLDFLPQGEGTVGPPRSSRRVARW